MQDVSRSAKKLRSQGAQEANQRRSDQHELAFPDRDMFDQPELESKQLTEQGRTELGWLCSSEVLHGTFQTSLSTGKNGDTRQERRNREVPGSLALLR